MDFFALDFYHFHWAPVKLGGPIFFFYVFPRNWRELCFEMEGAVNPGPELLPYVQAVMPFEKSRPIVL